MTQTRTFAKIVLQDLYLLYPHKTREIIGNTVPLPYFPKSEITDNQYSLKFKDWKRFIQIYLSNVKEFLYTGKKFYIPQRLGVFQIRKLKYRGNSYSHYRKTGEWKKMNNDHMRGYIPILRWDRRYRDNCALKFKRIWVARFTDTVWDDLMGRINNKLSLINTFING